MSDALVIILDTTRADRVNAGLTPHIWAHAAQAWHPVRAYTPSPWTVPSLVSFFTGKAPWELLAPTDRSLPESVPTLAERVENRRTAMVSANSYVTHATGFSRGFDRFESVESDEEAVAIAKRWWAEEEPQFVVVQLMTAHLPYEPTRVPPGETARVGDKFWDLDGAATYTDSADRGRIAALYDGGIRDLDDRVGELLGMAGDDAIVAIVSDHGEELFEHGGFEHGHAMWEEVVRIHAAISVPGVASSRPLQRMQIQHVGQQLAMLLEAQVDEDWPEPVPDVLGFSHPLDERLMDIHRWGARSEGGTLLLGPGGAYESGKQEGLMETITSIQAQTRQVGAGQPLPELGEADKERLKSLGYVR
ncbi:MAG: sulfatase-like hydrolase/transferase [Myxococcota bacterium]|nr:sulfatase-like hydrolase/transferase [Myxococcota bacterium]